MAHAPFISCAHARYVTARFSKNAVHRRGFSTFINPRRACAARVTVVVMSVCLSVCYTSGASFRPENAVTYSAGNEGQNNCGVFSENAPLQS